MTDDREFILHRYDSVRSAVDYARAVLARARSGNGDARGFIQHVWDCNAEGNPATEVDMGSCPDASSFDEFCTAGLNRWDEGMQMLRDAFNELGRVELPIPESIRRRKRWSDLEGQEVDVLRLYSGSEYWYDITRQQGIGGCPIVTVMVNVGTPYSVSGNDIIWRGIAGLLITDILEDAGYRVELWGVRYGMGTYSDEPRDLMTATLIKESHGALVLPMLIGVLSGWWYRSINWLTYYHIGSLDPNIDIDMRPSGGLGSPCDKIPDNARAALLGSDYTGKIFDLDDIWRAEDAVEAARKTLEQFNPSHEDAIQLV